MIASLLIAAAVAAAPADPATLSDAARAIEAGRLEQARAMIGRAVAAGAGGPSIDRLLADLAFASGKDAEALPRYRQLLSAKDAHPLIAERAAIAALRLGDFQAAAPLVDRGVNQSRYEAVPLALGHECVELLELIHDQNKRRRFAWDDVFDGPPQSRGVGHHLLDQ